MQSLCCNLFVNQAGAEKIQVWSVEELFGPLVEHVKVDGKFLIRMVNPRKSLTVQIGSSLHVNVHALQNNDIFVTPITVKTAAQVMPNLQRAMRLRPDSTQEKSLQVKVHALQNHDVASSWGRRLNGPNRFGSMH